MARHWSNGARRDPDDVPNACGCRATKTHRCLEPAAERVRSDLTPWVLRDLARLQGEDRRALLRSLGRARPAES